VTRASTTTHGNDERHSGPMNSTTRRGGAAVAAGSALALALGLLAATGASAEPDNQPYTVTVSAPSVSIGDQVTVTVAAASVDDLYAYSLDLGYDPALLEYVGKSAATDISGATFEKVSAGEVAVTHTKLGTSPATTDEDVTLVTAAFKAIGSGPATITARDLTAVDTAVAGASTAVVGSAVVGITKPAVPAPAAALKTKTSLTVKDRSIKPGQKLSTSVKVTAAGAVPAGTLTYTYRGKTVRQRVAVVDGKATVTFRPRVRGRHTLRVRFVPATGFTASTDSVKIRVKK
jgi:hypothetical protein